jgi:serine phosphatase RsbU (regulator of sigma subunit)
LSKKLTAQIALGLSILAWISLSVVDLSNQFSLGNNIDSGFNEKLPNILFFGYVVSLFTFYKARVDLADRLNLIDLLWKIFVTGMLTTVVSLSIRSLDFVLGGTQLISNVLVVDLLFLINLGLLTAFLIATLVVWKRLILYQKNKRLLFLWTIFEYFLFGSMLLDFTSLSGKEYFLIIVVALGLMVSANMKWVAFLSFKQKWKSILLLLLTLLYLVYFYMNLITYRNSYEFLSLLSNSMFIRAAFVFTSSYAVFSLLVIVFNLPTTSAFEQKLKEVVNFQRLSQSIQTEKNEEQVYEILLESAVRTVEADAAWIELKSSDELFLDQITYDKVRQVKSNFSDSGISFRKRIASNENKKAGVSGKLKGGDYKSVAHFPIWINDIQEGTLYLLKDVRDGFTKELIEIIETFTNQAAISIANFRMLDEAISNERYKEELKIAKQVQAKLLPKELDENKDFEISTFTIAADEVGGDYYDSFKISASKTAIIIGDVSGKGTSAAFHMAQMKGVFLALSQLDLSPTEFLEKANLAISSGLDKTSFVTISYFVLNSKVKSIEFARAGHVPSLYFDSTKNEAAYFKNKGLGLGIIRGSKFKEYIQETSISYKKGDVLVLYTDGITEAQNKSKQEFGYERLLKIVQAKNESSAEKLQDEIIGELYKFCDNELLEDDYSLVVVKFK